MATVNKVTQANYSVVTDPYPVFATHFNPAVDQINTNTADIATNAAATAVAQAAVDAIEALNSTVGGTTNLTETYKVLLNVTSANILAMNGAPVTLIAAPGAGKTIHLKSCVAIFDSTATTYANGGVIYLAYAGAATTPITNNLAATFLAAGDKVYPMNALTAAGGYSMWVNSGISITNDTAPFITGTGVMRLLVEYDVVTTGL